ncbi:hypothetical protein [Leptolyngbya sp. 7M]|uniref:hypothetical protein n=1 Tax=Leptolyngbya sp. 7M TaxID=2812896 RepID=UPI001B8AE819|nr:hypothetical protein [Leptolyngbya sp. 7M]QYO62785.1 hypothetical protein JVX88_22520 [Leptolyngbya sp. 7M]
MSRRFSQIKKGAEYDTALTNYVDYIRNAATRPTKRLQGGTRGGRRQTVPAALRPFGMDLGENAFVLVRVSQQSVTGLGNALTNRLFIQGTQLANADRLSGFRPARVQAFQGNGNAAYVQSKITKLFYLKYEGDSFTAPFGALTTAEEFETGASAVRTAVVTAFGAADIKRISFTPEKVPV